MKKIIAKPGFLFAISIFMVLASIISCSLTKGKAQAERAVEQFHQQFNAGQYKEIYQQGDSKFKEAIGEVEFVRILEGVKRKLGTVKNSTQAGWRVNTTPLGTVATVSCQVDFAEGKGVEQFSFLIDGEQTKLLRYDVNSPLLITK